MVWFLISPSVRLRYGLLRIDAFRWWLARRDASLSLSLSNKFNNNALATGLRSITPFSARDFRPSIHVSAAKSGHTYDKTNYGQSVPQNDALQRPTADDPGAKQQFTGQKEWNLTDNSGKDL